MSFNTEFFSSSSDPQRLLEVIPSKAEIFLHRMESLNITGSKLGVVDGVYTLATTLFTIAGASFVADELIGGFVSVKVSSTIGVLIPITDNDATTITVDPTDTLSERNVSGDLSDGVTYEIRVFSDQRFIGETIDKEINPNQEYKEFNAGYPEVTENEFLIRYKPEYMFTLRTAGKSIRKILFKSKDINPSSTNFEHYATGSNPRADNYFLVVALGKLDGGGKESRIVMLYTKIKPNGNCPDDAPIEDFINYPIMVKLFRESLFPEDEDLFRHMEEK